MAISPALATRGRPDPRTSTPPRTGDGVVFSECFDKLSTPDCSALFEALPMLIEALDELALIRLQLDDS